MHLCLSFGPVAHVSVQAFRKDGGSSNSTTVLKDQAPHDATPAAAPQFAVLGRALVSAPGWDRMPAELRDQLAEELNVLAVVSLGGDGNDATTDELVHVSVKANFRSLGRRFGKGTQPVAAAIASADPVELTAALRGTGSAEVEVNGEQVSVGPDDVVITETPRQGWAVATAANAIHRLDAAGLREHRRLQAAGDDTLKGTRQWWVYGFENVPVQQGPRYEQIRALNLQTARAWGIKEVFRSFWLCADIKRARSYFARWYGWAMRSRLAPVKKVARMCQGHLENILTFFVHRLTNGPIEGLNNKIQGLIKKAYGYRNKERFKRDIFFHLGGLDLYPTQ